MPLGLIAVGSALDPAEYDVKIIDGRLEQDPIKSVLAELDGATCLGMGVLTGAPIRDALNVSRAVKAAYPRLPIIWGGWHPSQFPADCLAEPSVDATVSGQGEEAFAEVVQRLSDHSNLDGISGVTWRDKSGQIIENPARPTKDLNIFPPLNYDLIDVEAYFAHKGKRQFDYISSVGCRFRCAFCADPFVYKRAWFGLTDERIANELLMHWKRHQFVEVTFQDDTFFTRRERVEDICNKFLSVGLKTAWTGTMRADQGFRLPDETLVTAQHRDKVTSYLDAGTEAGATLVIDGREGDVDSDGEGYFLKPTLFDNVTRDMSIYQDEIFGPVLSVLRVKTYDEALELINSNPYGNGTAIFTNDGGAARRFQNEVEVGMIGVNVPIPVPMAYYSFGGWKNSLFGDTHAHGMEGVHFYTRGKVVTSRWLDPSHGGIDLGFPQNV